MEQYITKTIEELKKSKVQRVGGLFNGDTPITFAEDEKHHKLFIELIEPWLREKLAEAWGKGAEEGINQTRGLPYSF